MPTKRSATKPTKTTRAPTRTDDSQTILVIGDPHASPDHDNDRADILSKLIDDLRPATVVQIGDLFDMASLCTYDRGLFGTVGRTYRADINAGLDFHERMWSSWMKSKSRYQPRRVALEGNHEHRLKRAVDLDHTLYDLMGFSDFQFDKWYTDVVQYSGATPSTITISGVIFGHHIAGVMGKALGGVHHAHSLLSKYHRSVVVGHSHQLDYKTHVSMDGKRLTGLVVGCYIDPEHDHAYSGIAQRNWWRGVTILRGVQDGEFDTEFVSTKRLRELYGVCKSPSRKRH